MNPIPIPVTLSPHFVNGKPRGYYLLAQRLFPNGSPALNKKQWLGFHEGNLIVTASFPSEWNSLMSMAVNCPSIEGKPFMWLAPAKLWPMPMGFRTYIPGTILKPDVGSSKVETTGVFKQYMSLFWLSLTEVTGEVLLGRKTLWN